LSKELARAASVAPFTCSSSFAAFAFTFVVSTASFAFEPRDSPTVLLANSFNPTVAAS